MAHLPYENVAALLWTLTRANLNSQYGCTNPPAGVQPRDFSAISEVIRQDPRFLTTINNAKVFFERVLVVGRTLPGSGWTGTDCDLQESQLTAIANLEGLARVLTSPPTTRAPLQRETPIE